MKLFKCIAFSACAALALGACAKTQTGFESAFHASFRRSFSASFMQSCMNSGRGIANVQSYCSWGLNKMLNYSDQQLVTIYKGKDARLVASRAAMHAAYPRPLI